MNKWEVEVPIDFTFEYQGEEELVIRIIPDFKDDWDVA